MALSVVTEPTTRDGILNAALTVLGTQGAAAFTVRAVAAQAGCSTTGIYTHFGGKRQLVEAIVVSGFDSLDRALAALDPEASSDPLDVCLAERRWALDNPTSYLVMFGRAVPDYEPSPIAQARVEVSFAVFRRLLEERGFPASEDGAHHIRAAVQGYVMLELVDFTPFDAGEAERLFTWGLRSTLQQFGA